MSTSSVSSSAAGSGYELGSLGGSTPLQVTGLASGLNTNQIVSELMAIKQRPLTALENRETGVEAADTQLQGIQTALQTVASDARALAAPSLYATSQQVTSSNATLVSAANSSGAGVGGYEVSVTQLANSAQRTFAYTPPTGGDTITVDGQPVTIAAGETAASLAGSINSDSNLDVYAAATNSGTLVFSDRQTGNTGSGFIQVSDPGGALTEQTSLAKQGQDAKFSVDGTSGSSSSNIVTTAIAGVTLTLNGLTTTAGPVTIDVAPPAPDASTIQTAVQQFVTDYNSAVSGIRAQLAQTPSSSAPTQGTLYNDQALSDLLSQMRTAMVTDVAGLTGGAANMLAAGVSTGAVTGSAPTQSQLDGELTRNTTTLAGALQSNPAGLQQLLSGWATNFSSLVDEQAGAGGTIAERLTTNATTITNLGQQVSAMQASLTAQQNQLVAQFAAMESALSKNQSESSYLTSQIAQLPTG